MVDYPSLSEILETSNVGEIKSRKIIKEKPHENLHSNKLSEEIKQTLGPGVYILKGYRSDFENGQTEEVLYIGRTESENVNVGERAYDQINIYNSTFRGNVMELGYKYLHSESFNESLENLPIKSNFICVTEIIMYTFEKDKSGYLGRNILENLLIQIRDTPPIFNKQFTHISKAKKIKQDKKREGEWAEEKMYKDAGLERLNNCHDNEE